MKIAVIGANGKSGSLIASEAIAKNLDVTGIVRNKQKITNDKIKVLEKDVFDLTYEDLEPFDVIVDALGFWTEQDVDSHSKSTKHLLALLENKPNRIIFVGGAASLYTDASHSLNLFNAPDFPEEYKLVANAQFKAFEIIKQASNVNWTYFSPAPVFNPDGERTGSYKLGRDELIVNEQGVPSISYADYAVALVDEIINNKHPQQRFTAVSEA